MPRWTIHYPAGAISRDDKDQIAEKVAQLYTELGLPAFWVNVFFHEHSDGSFYAGGKAKHNSVFFHIDHAARKPQSEEARLMFIDRVDGIMRPVLGEKYMKWEFNVYDHPRDNWRINGMIPPMDHPEVLKQWIEKNEPVPY